MATMVEFPAEAEVGGAAGAAAVDAGVDAQPTAIGAISPRIRPALSRVTTRRGCADMSQKYFVNDKRGIGQRAASARSR